MALRIRTGHACSTSSCECGAVEAAAAAEAPSDSRRSRRRFLGTTIAGVAAGLLGGVGFVEQASAQTRLSPDDALRQLMDGNRRFTAGRMTSFNDDLKMLKSKTAEKQEPFAAVLSCADSRVPVEMVFDQSIGKLFVTRVAGNLATSELIASLEYGVAVLGTRAIVVLGHASCGAVKAAIDGKAVPGQISGLYRYIRPAVDQAGKDVEAAIKANARIQAALLRSSSPVIAEAIEKKQLKVVAGYYELASGQVTLLE